MNGEKRLEPVNILLSREELLFVLNSLQADFIPGLDPEPQGELTLAQESFGITVAGRALRARELARQRPGGEIELHTCLLYTSTKKKKTKKTTRKKNRKKLRPSVPR